jgi:thioredoxin reductase
MYDAIVVGGGPAGLSAALLLGRSRRTVLVCDTGEARNAASHASHSFLTRDGTPPLELRRLGSEQLATYPGVELTSSTVVDACAEDDHFVTIHADGRRVAARKLVLATGVRDELPAIEGLEALWGRSVFHCPYCDGWEVRDQPLAVYPNTDDPALVMQAALLIRQWSRDLILLTNGPAPLDDESRSRLALFGITLREEPIVRVEGEDGTLKQIVFASGDTLSRRAIFVRPRQAPRNELAVRLGCELSDDPPFPGLIRVDASGQTTVQGVYAAGDVVTPIQQVATAVSSGAVAGAMANLAMVMAHTSP